MRITFDRLGWGEVFASCVGERRHRQTARERSSHAEEIAARRSFPIIYEESAGGEFLTTGWSATLRPLIQMTTGTGAGFPSITRRRRAAGLTRSNSGAKSALSQRPALWHTLEKSGANRNASGYRSPIARRASESRMACLAARRRARSARRAANPKANAPDRAS